jgi:hypothetical protein
MIRNLVLILIAWLLALATIVLLNSEHKPINGGLPIVKTALATCPALPNPCERINCNGRPTREIA